MTETNSNSFPSLFKDGKSFGRLLVFILVLVAIAAGVIYFIFYLKKQTKSAVKIDFTSSGATIILSDDEKPIAAQFLLPAAARWTNTGIRPEPNATIQITASGRVHLASHRLIEAAVADRKPPFEWCSPNGLIFKNQRDKDVFRRGFLINPNAAMGSIVGYFQKDGDPDPTIENQRPDKLIAIKEKTEIKAPDYPCTLWLVINDILLDPKDMDKSKIAYYGPMDNLSPEEKKEKDTDWNYIRQNDYWDLWYDDNIGEYLIQLKLSK